MPAPRAKAWMQKPQGGGKFLVQVVGGARGVMVMAKIDSCITTMCSEEQQTSDNLIVKDYCFIEIFDISLVVSLGGVQVI